MLSFYEGFVLKLLLNLLGLPFLTFFNNTRRCRQQYRFPGILASFSVIYSPKT